MTARQAESVASSQQQAGQQLQRGHSVWLAPERFERPDFSPDQCVAELRRYVSGGRLVDAHIAHVRTAADSMCAVQVPLPTVKAELQTHLVRLKNKVRLSTHLGPNAYSTAVLLQVPLHSQPGLALYCRILESDRAATGGGCTPQQLQLLAQHCVSTGLGCH